MYQEVIIMMDPGSQLAKKKLEYRKIVTDENIIGLWLAGTAASRNS